MDTDRFSLEQTYRHPVDGSIELGQVDSEEQILVSFWLASGRPGLLEEADGIAAEPIRSRTYLSRAGLQAKYGPAPEAVQAVKAFANDNGLKLASGDDGGMLLHLLVPPSKVKDLFGVDLNLYRLPGGVPFRARTGEVSLRLKDFDTQQLPLIRGVFGLDNRPQARRSPLSPSSHFDSASFQLSYPLPDQFKGEGQCVGILEFGGIFNNQNARAIIRSNAAANVSVVTPIDFHPAPNASFHKETSLDVQIIARSVPNAKKVLYLLPNSEQGWITGLQRVLSDTEHAPSVLSISAAWPERGGNPSVSYWTDAAFDALEDMFARATLIGMTICCASGDDGPALDDGPRVFYPASSRFVLACGGTQNSTGAEVVWSGQNGASGGGISDKFPMPVWQSRVRANVVANHLNRSANALEGRLVPDVAATAIATIDGYGSMAGTSVAAPLWAGLIAVANQQLLAKSIKKTVGNLTTLLYDQSFGLQTACNDILTGNNAVPRGNLAYYSAREGWDACTGWGSPTGQPLILKLLQNASLDSAAPTPPVSETDEVTGKDGK